MKRIRSSFLEATARQRVDALLDSGSFREFLPPQERVVSPHLFQVDIPAAFDDGVVVGEGTVHGNRVLIGAQEGAFLGGAVGEVHGAKLTGLLRRAIDDRAFAVVLLLESGGVRLHEANAGLIAVSRIMKAVLNARIAGVQVLAVVGGGVGCFGGMGIVARCCDTVVMTEEGRLGLSGPEVIEAAMGVEEFDSRNKALVWQTVGGRHRYLCGDCDHLVEDDLITIKEVVHQTLQSAGSFTLEELEREHDVLSRRLRDVGKVQSAVQVRERLRHPDAESIPSLYGGRFLEAAALVRSFAAPQE